MGRRRLQAKKSLIHRFLVWGGFKRGKHLAGSKTKVFVKKRQEARDLTPVLKFSKRARQRRGTAEPKKIIKKISAPVLTIGTILVHFINWPVQLVGKIISLTQLKVERIRVESRARRRFKQKAREKRGSDEEIIKWLKSLKKETIDSPIPKNNIKPVALALAGDNIRVPKSDKKTPEVVKKKLKDSREQDNSSSAKNFKDEKTIQFPKEDVSVEEEKTSHKAANLLPQIEGSGREAQRRVILKANRSIGSLNLLATPKTKSALFKTERLLNLGIKILTVLLVLLAAGFASYYLYDQYKIKEKSVGVERAAPNLVAAVRKNPQNPNLRVDLGRVYMARGNYKEAIHQFKQALKIDSEHQAALVYAGLAYMQLKKDDLALSYFQKELRLTEDTDFQAVNEFRENALFYSAVVLHRAGRLSEAERNLKEALLIKSGYSDTYFLLGRVYLDKKEYRKAIEQFRKTIRLDPRFADAYYGMGLAYENLKDYKMAKDLYREAIKVEPNFTKAKEALQRLEKR
jgi:tetratricopeptide (TPR) repeat protein